MTRAGRNMNEAESHEDLTVLADITRYHTAKTPDSVALVFEGRQTSFARLDQNVSQVANGLICEGIQSQQNVAWLDINSDYFFEMLFGCAKSNTVICPVNWRLAAPEIAYILNDAEAEILFVGERFIELVESIRDQLINIKKIIAVSGEHQEWEAYVSWRDKQSKEDPWLDTLCTDIAIQMYTSGTTGYPKGVLLASGALLEPTTDDSDDMEWNRWTSNDVSLLVMPCFHIAGLRWGVMGLLPGATTVILPEFDPVRVAQGIPAHQVTKLFLVPAALQFVLQASQGQDNDFSSLHHIWYGASPIPLELLKDAMNVFECEFVQTYGLTETSAQTTYLPPGDHDPKGNKRMKSAGKALPNIQIRIVDENGHSLLPGEIGEICIKSPANMIGYWKLPEETAKTIRNGWVHSGDAGYMDEELIAYAKQGVAAYKAPKSVDFTDALPRNPSGKILKKDLRASYWQGSERMVQ